MSLSGARPMVIGWVPSGTSFNTAPSNFRTSLDIFFYPPPTEAERTLPGIPLPDLQAIEHPFRFRNNAQNDHTDVVAAAVLVGQIDDRARRVRGQRPCHDR